MMTQDRSGADILAAIALVRAGLYDRKARAFVTVQKIMAAVGRETIAGPPLTPEVVAFIAAEEALKTNS